MLDDPTDDAPVGEASAVEIIAHSSCPYCFDGTDLEHYITPLTWLDWAHHGISATNDRVLHGNFFGFIEDNVMRISKLHPELTALVPSALEGIERQRRHYQEWLTNRSLPALELLASAVALHGPPPVWDQSVVNMVAALMLERDVNPTATITVDSTPVPVPQAALELQDFHRARLRPSGHLALRTPDSMLYDVFLGTPGEEAIVRWMPSETTLLVPATLEPLVTHVANHHDPKSVTRVAFDEDPSVVDTMRTLMADGTELDLALDLARRL